jgi:hypothetical protein
MLFGLAAITYVILAGASAQPAAPEEPGPAVEARDAEGSGLQGVLVRPGANGHPARPGGRRRLPVQQDGTAPEDRRRR